MSSLTSWLETVETLPTLSSATHLIVVVPSVVRLKPAVAALTVVAVPLVVGLLPSVVYLIRLTSAPPSVAPIAIATGEVVYQPAEQAAVLHWIELVGAAASACAVKLVPALERPALFVAVTLPLSVPAVLSKLYAPPVCDQPVPRVG